MQLRAYQDSDWPRLCEIHDLARMIELRSAGLIDAFLSLEQTAHAEGLFDGQVTVAVVDDGVQGFVAVDGDELTWLYVHPASSRRGIGRTLVRHAISSHPGRLTAEVLVGNDTALALYLSEGFKVLRRVDGQLVGNERFAASGHALERAG
jgi:ribosomal protein S18 acetylase RimI-like enzyme